MLRARRVGIARIKGGGGAFDPLLLFAGSEIGGFYRASEAIDSWNQISAGTTPITAVGQPIGFAADTHLWGGKTLGALLATQPELIVNGGPFTNTTGITLVSSTPSIAGGILTLTGGRGEWPLSGLTVGRFYAASVTVRKGVGNAQRIQSWTWATVPTTNPTTSFVTYPFLLPATATSGVLRLYADALSDPTSSLEITGVSVKELPGYHGLQATAANRPLLAASSAYYYVDHVDGTDVLATTFPNMGANCTVAYVTSSGVTILTAQSISGAYSLPVEDWFACLVIDRALTINEAANLTDWLNRQRP